MGKTLVKGCNKWIGVGYIDARPEIKRTRGSIVAAFRLRVPQTFKSDDGGFVTREDPVPVVAWGALAAVVDRIAKPGVVFHVEGAVIVTSKNKSEVYAKFIEAVRD
jgi:single-stranded DNA-binding protein